jgi:hypothetical protein
LSPATKRSNINEEPVPAKIRWGILFDGNVGFGGWGLKNQTYKYTYPANINNGETRDIPYSTGFLDYNLGILGEFYFLPFMGVGVGGGLGTSLAPYIRAEIPFLFTSVKLGVSFDYLFWKPDSLFFKTEKERGASLPAGYRVRTCPRIKCTAFYSYCLCNNKIKRIYVRFIFGRVLTIFVLFRGKAAAGFANFLGAWFSH